MQSLLPANLQFYHCPDEGNELPHTATGNTWHSLTANKADSTLQRGNGPCGTKTHMVAARIHILVFSATLNHSNQMPISQKVSKINLYQHNHASQAKYSLYDIGYKNYNSLKSQAGTLNAAVKRPWKSHFEAWQRHSLGYNKVGHWKVLHRVSSLQLSLSFPPSPKQTYAPKGKEEAKGWQPKILKKKALETAWENRMHRT